MEKNADNHPGLARGLYRIGVFLACIAFVIYFFWETYSASAALVRLHAAAKIFPYTETCDAEGKPIAMGAPNCVDLGRYVFINGPTLTAFRRPCSTDDEPSAHLVLEEGKASRTDIIRVEKALVFRSRNGWNEPCNAPVGES